VPPAYKAVQELLALLVRLAEQPVQLVQAVLLVPPVLAHRVQLALPVLLVHRAEQLVPPVLAHRVPLEQPVLLVLPVLLDLELPIL
jgi:hypothetical protein